MQRNKSICFLSYAREDLSQARKIYNYLINQGIDIWFDKESIPPGAKWKLEINRAIRSSRYFIVLLSKNSVSKKGFVQKEIKEAIDVLKEYPDDEIYIIPVRLDNCEPSNQSLLELNWVDLYEDYARAINKLVQFLRIEMTIDKIQEKNKIKIQTTLIRFNGLYKSNRNGSWHYLRFYDDGVVLTCPIRGEDLKKISKWFHRDSFHLSRGIYKVDGNKIRFSSTSSEGTVNYEGEIIGDKIFLNTHSLINGYKGKREYKFISLE